MNIISNNVPVSTNTHFVEATASQANSNQAAQFDPTLFNATTPGELMLEYRHWQQYLADSVNNPSDPKAQEIIKNLTQNAADVAKNYRSVDGYAYNVENALSSYLDKLDALNANPNGNSAKIDYLNGLNHLMDVVNIWTWPPENRP